MCKCSKILGCLILFILLSFALLVPLIYYVLQANSATSQKLGECQGRMKNLEEQKTTLEMQQDRAKEEGAALKSELLSTTKCLQETQGRLDSCSNRLHILQNNITALRAKITRLGGRDAELEPEERGEQETNLMSGTCSNSSDARERSTPVGNVCGVAGYLPLLALSLTGTLLLLIGQFVGNDISGGSGGIRGSVDSSRNRLRHHLSLYENSGLLLAGPLTYRSQTRD